VAVVNTVIIIALVAFWLSLPIINGLKGKWWMAGLAVLCIGGLAVIPLITAIRLAKPGSWWWQHRYGAAEQDAAARRFSGARRS
jgi:hypothetical protein